MRISLAQFSKTISNFSEYFSNLHRKKTPFSTFKTTEIPTATAEPLLWRFCIMKLISYSEKLYKSRNLELFSITKVIAYKLEKLFIIRVFMKIFRNLSKQQLFRTPSDACSCKAGFYGMKNMIRTNKKVSRVKFVKVIQGCWMEYHKDVQKLINKGSSSWYGKTRVMSYELRGASYEFRVESLKVRVEFKSVSVNPQVTSSNPRVTSSNLRVTSSNAGVTSSNPQVKSSNLRVTNSNPRVTSSNSWLNSPNQWLNQKLNKWKL